MVKIIQDIRFAVLIMLFLTGCVTAQNGHAPQSFLQDRETVEVAQTYYDKKPIPLVAHIQWPQGQGPFPALVYMGGCNGWDGAGTAYMQEQLSWFEGRGYAVVMLDSLGSREVTNTCAIDPKSGRFVYPLDLARDAKLAFSWLSKNPKIKPDRIGLFGFSAGGGGAVEVAQSKEKDYRALFAIYGWCDRRIPNGTWIKNITYVAGELDNEVFPDRCVKARTSPGIEADIHLYKGVHHGYMLPALAQGATVYRGYGATVYLKYDGAARADTIRRAQEWFDRWLLN